MPGLDTSAASPARMSDVDDDPVVLSHARALLSTDAHDRMAPGSHLVLSTGTEGLTDVSARRADEPATPIRILAGVGREV